MNGWWRIWGIQTVRLFPMVMWSHHPSSFTFILLRYGYCDQKSPLMWFLYVMINRSCNIYTMPLYVDFQLPLYHWIFSIAYPWLRQSFDIVVHQLGTGVAFWIRLLLLDLCQLQSPNKNHCTTLKSAHNSPKNGVYRHTQTCKTQNIDFSLKQNLNLNRIKPL